MIPYVNILNATLVLNLLCLIYIRFRPPSFLFTKWFPTTTITTTTNIIQQQKQKQSEEEDEDHDNKKLKQQQTNNYDIAMKRRHTILLYRIYLPVYLLATAADWLQGPYKYAVYSAFGYDQKSISYLFVAGFGSGMTLGSIIGGCADSMGRKRMALVYCCCYFMSCLAKHCRLFSILLIGRVLGGIATSLLFSVFDSWLIKAHTLNNINKDIYLSESFSVANFGSSCVAILSGLIAQRVVEDYDNYDNNNSYDDALRDTPWMIATTKKKTIQSNNIAPPSNKYSSSSSSSSSSLRPLFQNAAKQWFIQEGEMNGEIPVGPPIDVNDQRWDVAWIYQGGGIVAFDLALVPLALCFLLALAFWDENYGGTSTTSTSTTKYDDTTEKNNDNKNHEHDQCRQVEFDNILIDNSESESNNNNKPSTITRIPKMANDKTNGYLFGSLREASLTIWRSSGIFNLCCVTSFFEGAMYVFILLWTPVLRGLRDHDDDTTNEPPLGLVFATFMVCCMFGTSVFSILSTKMGIRPSKILVFILALSSLSCYIISITSTTNSSTSSSGKTNNNNNDVLSYGAMLLFEGCIGAYYPAMSTVKGSIVPENQRAAIYSVFRLPMNLVVLLNLCSNLDYPQAFNLCFVMLGIATILQLRVVQWEVSKLRRPSQAIYHV